MKSIYRKVTKANVKKVLADLKKQKKKQKEEDYFRGLGLK